MKPRIFVSSTYYDLRYLRESLEKFLLNMNFEPVLFEANKVTFEHGKPLDISCFNEVTTCHIMILVIGGRYGSIISEQDSDAEKQIYDKEYISITRREYETALKQNIPTFIFIDKNVYGEYNTYKINREFYEEAIKNSDFKFFHVDSINIFKFIDLVSTKALKAFERIEEIEYYLKDQISGMFHLYLESLKNNNKQDEIFDAVKELKNLTENMNAVVKEVGKKIIDPEKYEEVINEQFKVLLKFFFDKFEDAVEVNDVFDVEDDIINNLFKFFIENILTEEKNKKFTYSIDGNYAKWALEVKLEIELINRQLDNIFHGFTVNSKIRNIIDEYIKRVKPLITSPTQQQLFNNGLKNQIKHSGLPF